MKTTLNSNILHIAVDGSKMGRDFRGDTGVCLVTFHGMEVTKLISVPTGILTSADAEVLVMTKAIAMAAASEKDVVIYYDCNEAVKAIRAALDSSYSFTYTGDKVVLDKATKDLCSLSLTLDSKLDRGLPASLNNGRIRLVKVKSHEVDHLLPKGASYAQVVEFSKLQLKTCHPDQYGDWLNVIADQGCKHAARYGVPMPFKK